MWYLFFQIWLWLLIAYILGWFTNWFFCCRNKQQDDDCSVYENSSSDVVVDTSDKVNFSTRDAGVTASLKTSTGKTEVSEDWKPQGFTSRPSDVDDLKRIKGVGAVIEGTLNKLGIYQFDQVANWNSDNINWVEGFIAFPGRISREGWVNQAKTLGRGEVTEFAKRVDSGEVGY